MSKLITFQVPTEAGTTRPEQGYVAHLPLAPGKAPHKFERELARYPTLNP